MNVITEAHMDLAIAAAKKGRYFELTYDQAFGVNECRTACCVLGFARAIAGNSVLLIGPRHGELEDTPRMRTLAALMRCPHEEVLEVMEAVLADGSVLLPAGSKVQLRFDSGYVRLNFGDGSRSYLCACPAPFRVERAEVEELAVA